METFSSALLIGIALIGGILLSVLIAWGVLNLLFASAMALHIQPRRRIIAYNWFLLRMPKS